MPYKAYKRVFKNMILQRLFNKITEPYFDFRDKLENLAKGYGFIPTSYYADPKKEIAHKVLPIIEIISKVGFQRRKYVSTNLE